MNGVDHCTWNGLRKLGLTWNRAWVYDQGVDTQHAFSVNAGTNVLNLYPRENGAFIDWLVITANPDLDIQSYVLESTMIAGEPDVSSESETVEVLPDRFMLYQNYPNPFNPETRIIYEIPEDCHVSFSVYNMHGQRVVVLTEGWKSAGVHELPWNAASGSANDIVSGIYFGRFQAGEYTRVIKMSYLK
jgi:hypothetical protein